jgi:hypothetical protein
MTERSHDRDIGELQADMRNTIKLLDGFGSSLRIHTEKTQEQFESLEGKLGTILERLSEAKGGWKAIIGVGATVGAAVSIGLIKIAPFIGIIPK